MRLFFTILLSFPFTSSFCQSKIDTAQVAVANRSNRSDALSRPYVILISADGFRHDYAKKYNAENILKLSGQGVQAKAMIPSYPSITFPNHWSLITGLYPSHHGLVDNFFYDHKLQKNYAMNNRETAEDGSWYGGIPLWALAEKQGVLSASMQWVGSASDAGGTRPTYYYHYHEKFPPLEKVEKVINWLKLPESQRPHFISLYFPEVDGAGHHFGPDAKETETAVHLIDDAIGDLVEKVDDLGLPNVNFIFVSDHGMIHVDSGTSLEIPKILTDKNRFDYYNSQTLLRVYVKDRKEVKSIFKTLKANKTDDYEIYLDKKLPKHLHFATRDDKYGRIGQILMIPKAPKVFLEKGQKVSTGKHGYDPRLVPEMKATFLAWGPAFEQGLVIDEFENVNVYPMVAEILGLTIHNATDGKLRVLKPILKKEKLVQTSK